MTVIFNFNTARMPQILTYNVGTGSAANGNIELDWCQITLQFSNIHTQIFFFSFYFCSLQKLFNHIYLFKLFSKITKIQIVVLYVLYSTMRAIFAWNLVFPTAAHTQSSNFSFYHSIMMTLILLLSCPFNIIKSFFAFYSGGWCRRSQFTFHIWKTFNILLRAGGRHRKNEHTLHFNPRNYAEHWAFLHLIKEMMKKWKIFHKLQYQLLFLLNLPWAVEAARQTQRKQAYMCDGAGADNGLGVLDFIIFSRPRAN